MTITRSFAARAGVAAAAVAGLVATSAPALAAQHSRAAEAQTIAASLSKSGKLSVTGTTVHAGVVKVTLRAAGNEGAVEVLRIHSGYSWSKFSSDLKTFAKSQQSQSGPTKAQLAALDRAIKSTTQYGGPDNVPGKPLSVVRVVLPTAGTYWVFDDSNGVPSQPKKITVTRAAGNAQALPKTPVTVTATVKNRFGGATKLPHDGWLTFTNTSNYTPHMLIMQHVKEGTTRKQVEDSFQNQSSGPPSWALPEGSSTDIMGMGRSMTVTYHLTKGEYVLLCFMPDPKTGMPHAFMGMIGIVHLT